MGAVSRKLESWERELVAGAAPVIDDLRRRFVGCPPVRVRPDASAEAHSSENRAAMLAHVESCPACRALRADLEPGGPTGLDPPTAGRLFRRVAGRAARSPGRIQPPWKGWVPATVTGAACLVALCFVVRGRQSDSRPAAALSTPVASVQVVSPPVPAPPVRPSLTKPAITLTAVALTWRDGAAEDDGFAEAIAPAFDAFRADRFAQSERLLGALSARYPSSVEIPFYQGVCQLFLGRPDEAVATLRHARRAAGEAFSADTEWYLALALVQAGRVAEARSHFAALCRGASSYTVQACEAAR